MEVERGKLPLHFGTASTLPWVPNLSPVSDSEQSTGKAL